MKILQKLKWPLFALLLIACSFAILHFSQRLAQNTEKTKLTEPLEAPLTQCNIGYSFTYKTDLHIPKHKQKGLIYDWKLSKGLILQESKTQQVTDDTIHVEATILPLELSTDASIQLTLQFADGQRKIVKQQKLSVVLMPIEQNVEPELLLQEKRSQKPTTAPGTTLSAAASASLAAGASLLITLLFKLSLPKRAKPIQSYNVFERMEQIDSAGGRDALQAMRLNIAEISPQNEDVTLILEESSVLLFTPIHTDENEAISKLIERAQEAAKSLQAQQK